MSKVKSKTKNMKTFEKYEDIVFQIIGAAMHVHHILNYGLSEPIYQEALQLELSDEGIKSEREKALNCFYKNYKLEKTYKADFVVGDDIIVEIKSRANLLPEHRAQLFNYMRLTQSPIGLLINFGRSHLQSERYGYVKDTNECVLLDRYMHIKSPNSQDIL